MATDKNYFKRTTRAVTASAFGNRKSYAKIKQYNSSSLQKAWWEPVKITSVVMKELERYYKALGLEIGASPEEINQAYRDLAFIWHPDRIPKDNQRLLEKAIAKLKEINHAREQLRLLQTETQQQIPSPPEQPPPPKTKQPPQSASAQTKRPYHQDLSGADLSGANLKEKDLSGRNLANANLSGADLSDSFLHNVNLEAANLSKAKLFRANLLCANLRRANLQEAYLIGADLSGADLREADLRGAKIGFGNRVMVKLTGAILTGVILPDGSIHN